MTAITRVNVRAAGIRVVLAGIAGLPPVLGSTLQAWDALTVTANTMQYFNASKVLSSTSLTTTGRNLVGAVDEAAVRLQLGLVIGTNVQAYNANLAGIAGLTSAADRLAYFTGGDGASALATFTSFGRSMVAAANAAAGRTALSLGTIATQDAAEISVNKLHLTTWIHLSPTAQIDGTLPGLHFLANAVQDFPAHVNWNATGDCAIALQTASLTFDQDLSMSSDVTFNNISGSLIGNADSATVSASCTGNAATASALESTRTIGGSNFNGSGNVTSFPSPGIIGGTTPSSASFTTVVIGSAKSLLLGTAGTAIGSVGFFNATSGTATVAPPTGALGDYTVTLPNAASTLPIFGQQVTFSGPTAARTITLPDANFTVARTDAANTFTGTQTISQIDFGNSDTSLTRVSAGDLQIESNIIYRASGTDVAVADGGTGRSTGTTAYCLIATGTTATGVQQTLGSGGTTQILVGGGASALPVWTTATGSGSPVRATSPTLSTTLTVSSIASSGSGLAVVFTSSDTSSIGFHPSSDLGYCRLQFNHNGGAGVVSVTADGSAYRDSTWDQRTFIVRGRTASTVNMVIRNHATAGTFLDFQNSSSSSLAMFRSDASWKPPQLADASAANDSVYYSTNVNKLVYKDSGGTVNNLY